MVQADKSSKVEEEMGFWDKRETWRRFGEASALLKVTQKWGLGRANDVAEAAILIYRGAFLETA